MSTPRGQKPPPTDKVTATWQRSAITGELVLCASVSRPREEQADERKKAAKPKVETLTLPDGTQYRGHCDDGKPHGRGSNTNVQGHRYEGEWLAGKRHGEGVMVWGSGEWPGSPRVEGHEGRRYEGQWCKGEMHGQGYCSWASGNEYEGEYKAGKLHGHGVFIHADGSKYEGEYRDG
eukprot:COSAG02_NODE_20454_length_830_cov_0.836066_1_plen_176_part_10